MQSDNLSATWGASPDLLSVSVESSATLDWFRAYVWSAGPDAPRCPDFVSQGSVFFPLSQCVIRACPGSRQEERAQPAMAASHGIRIGHEPRRTTRNAAPLAFPPTVAPISKVPVGFRPLSGAYPAQSIELELNRRIICVGRHTLVDLCRPNPDLIRKHCRIVVCRRLRHSSTSQRKRDR